MGKNDRNNIAIFIEVHVLDTRHTVIAGGFVDGTSMVADIPLIRSWNLEDRVMTRAVSDRGIALKDFSVADEWTKRRI